MRGDSVTKHFLLELPALLCLKRQICRRSRDQATDANRLASLVAVTVITRVDPVNGLLDLFKQLAFAVTRAQFERMLLLDGGAVSRVGHDDRVFTQVLSSLAGAVVDFLLQHRQFVAKESHLFVVHVLGVGHGLDFLVAQGFARFRFPVVGQLGIFFGGSLRRRRNQAFRDG